MPLSYPRSCRGLFAPLKLMAAGAPSPRWSRAADSRHERRAARGGHGRRLLCELRPRRLRLGTSLEPAGGPLGHPPPAPSHPRGKTERRRLRLLLLAAPGGRHPAPRELIPPQESDPAPGSRDGRVSAAAGRGAARRRAGAGTPRHPAPPPGRPPPGSGAAEGVAALRKRRANARGAASRSALPRGPCAGAPRSGRGAASGARGPRRRRAGGGGPRRSRLAVRRRAAASELCIPPPPGSLHSLLYLRALSILSDVSRAAPNRRSSLVRTMEGPGPIGAAAGLAAANGDGAVLRVMLPAPRV